MKSRINQTVLAMLTGCMGAGLSLTPALADSVNKAAAAAPEEIIVTARKREESLMKTPVVIQALGTKQIENLHLTNLQAVTSVAPGAFIEYAFAQSGVVAYIRGIGVASNNSYSDQSIGITVDGFSSATGILFRQGIFDSTQIEILKGPQSLFFGKSTSAGVIALHTADPTKQWDAKVSVGYEFNADEMDLNGYVSGPLSDTLGIRIAGYHNTSKGWLYNKNPGSPAPRLPADDDSGGRLTLKYDNPDIGLRVNFKASYTYDYVQAASIDLQNYVCSGTTNPLARFAPYDDCTANTTTVSLAGSKPYSATADFNHNGGSGFLTNTPQPLFKDGKPYSYTKAALALLNVDYDIAPGLTLTSVTALSYAKAVDSGRTAVSIGVDDIGTDPKFQEFSEELRLTSNWKDRWYNFMIGGLYNPQTRKDQLILNYPNNGVLPAFTDFWSDDRSVMKNKAAGVFGQVILTPIQHWELAAGVRYSHISKQFTSLFSSNNLGTASGEVIQTIPDSEKKFSENATTPEVTLTYRPTDDTTAFISYKRGYKGPAWNSPIALSAINATTMATKPPVAGERAKGFEGGVKAQLLDRQVSLTATGYLYDYKGLQVSFFQPLLNTALLANGADARVQGLELGADYTPDAVRGLTVNAFINYNDTHFTRFTGGACYGGQVPATGCVTLPGGAKVQDLTGRSPYLAPKWAGNVGASYRWDVNDKYTAAIDSQVQYTSSYFATPELVPQGLQKSFFLLNAAVHLARADDTWDLTLLCRNCTNKIYYVYGQDGGTTPPSANVHIARTRQIMLTLSVHPEL
jgi:iron complex outermembrane receptor protein